MTEASDSGEVTAADVEPKQLIDKAWEVLAEVYDPELGLDLVSLGLIYNIGHQDGKLIVEMTLTTPGCPASENLVMMAECAVCEAVNNQAETELKIVWDPPWDPSRIKTASAVTIGFRR